MKRCDNCGKYTPKRIKFQRAGEKELKVCKECESELSYQSYSTMSSIIRNSKKPESGKQDVILLINPEFSPENNVVAYVMDNDPAQKRLLSTYRSQLRESGEVGYKTKRKTYESFELPGLTGKKLVWHKGVVVLEMFKEAMVKSVKKGEEKKKKPLSFKGTEMGRYDAGKPDKGSRFILINPEVNHPINRVIAIAPGSDDGKRLIRLYKRKLSTEGTTGLKIREKNLSLSELAFHVGKELIKDHNEVMLASNAITSRKKLEELIELLESFIKSTEMLFSGSSVKMLNDAVRELKKFKGAYGK